MLAASTLAVGLPFMGGAAHAATPSTLISHVTLVSPSNNTVATASVACTSTFDYLIVGASTSLVAGANVLLNGVVVSTFGMASTYGATTYLPAFLPSCPAVNSTITIVNPANNNAVIGTGTITSYS